MGYTHDISRNSFVLEGEMASRGFQRWCHTFTGVSLKSGRRRTFFVEFYLCNPEEGKPKPVFPRKKCESKASFLMIKAGVWGEGGLQLNRFWGWNKIELEKGWPFSISAGECFISEEGTHGSIKVSAEDAVSNKELMSDCGEISWSIVFDKNDSLVMSERSIARMNAQSSNDWYAAGMSCRCNGEICLNGERFRVQPRYGLGYSDKLSSADMELRHIRLSSNHICIEGQDKKIAGSSLCIFGAAQKNGKWTAVASLKHEGKEYLINMFKPMKAGSSSVKFKEGRFKLIWDIELGGLLSSISLELACNRSTSLKLRYASNEEQRVSRLWSCATASGTLIVRRFGHKPLRLKARDCFCEYGPVDNTKKNIQKTNKQ